MVKEFFNFFQGSDFPISIVVVCIIIFVVFLYSATISGDKKDFKQKTAHDEDDA